MPVGTYAYTPEQLERINARRERRGQEPLIQRGSKYAEEYSKRQASEKPKRRFPETDEDDTQVAKMIEKMKGPEKSRLEEYAGGKFRMGAVSTPRLAAGAEKTKAFQGRLMREFSQRGPMLIHRGGMAT